LCERNLPFFSLHQITSASKQHHHRFLLPQTGQTSRLASAAARRRNLFRSRSQKFPSLSIQEAQLCLREAEAAVSRSSRRRRRECAAFAARGARKPRNEPEPSRLREGRSRRHETRSGSSQLRRTRGCSAADPPAAAAGGERSKLL
jgi:hypothetical protein